MSFFFFFFNDTATTEIYTLSLHDALPIWGGLLLAGLGLLRGLGFRAPGFCERLLRGGRSEEHTSELQSRLHLVCRLLLEKKKKKPHIVRYCEPSQPRCCTSCLYSPQQSSRYVPCV